MERLPCLVHELIGEHLSYEDLLNLRLTCKRLREFVDQKPFKKLILFFKHYGKCHRVFPSDRLVGYANSLRFDDPAILQSAKFQVTFGQVASLIICQNYPFMSGLVAELTSFSQLDRLEHLELNAMAGIAGRLKLANLRVAAFHTCKESTFELDCPQLETLNLGHLARATLLGACDRLTHLQVNNPDYSQNDLYLHQPYLADLFPRLPHLSTVCFEEIVHLNHFLSAILDGRLPATQLNRVELKHCQYLFKFGQLADCLTMLSQRPERKQVRFFVNREPIASQTKLDELRRFIERQWNGERPFQFWRPKPSLLDEMRRTSAASCLLDIVREFNVTRTVELDERLIDGLKNVQRLTLAVCSLLDDPLFDRMMLRFKQLEVLNLNSACLRQDQLDRLPDHLPYLRRFSCTVNKERSPASLYFLGRFKNLTTADFAFVLEKPLLELLFRRCELLKKVDFWNMPSKWRVEILRSGKIQQLFETQKVDEFANLQASIDHFYSNDLLGLMFMNQQSGRSL